MGLLTGTYQVIWNYLTLLREIRWDDLVDIGLATLLLWIGIPFLRTARTRGVGLGLLTFGGLFLTASHLELKLTVWILQGIAAVIVLIVVVVYQTEIRRFLERFPARFRKGADPAGGPASELAGLLTETLSVLSAEKRGAWSSCRDGTLWKVF